MKEQLFTDAREVRRSDDNLKDEYTTREVIERIWNEHLRPRFKLLLAAGAAMAFTAAATGAIPFLIQQAADQIFVNRNTAMAFTIAGAIAIVTLVKAASEYVSNVAVGYLGHRFIADLRVQMFARLSTADLSWIQSVHSGRLVSSFLNDAQLVRQTASRAVVALGENLLKVVILVCVMIYMDPRFSAVILVFLPLGLLTLGRQRRKMRKSTTKSLQETGDLSALISQTLQGMRIVRAYRQEQLEVGRARATIDRALEFTMRGARARAASGPAMEILVGLGFALAVVVVGYRGIRGADSLGHFMGFMTSALLIYQPLKSVATLQTQLQEGVAAASRIFGIIDQQPRLVEAPDARPLELKKGEIVLEDVSFSYEKASPVLKGVSLKVPAGSTVALVGPSGSGKSTIINLVLRFFDPDKGRVLIDGQDISKVTIDSLRDALALVTQDPVLFDDTISANISYGLREEEQGPVEDAARAAAAHDFIKRLPQGYNTRAGEAGNILSGGEKQRIAIARAVFKNAPILLLDEPTSSLDGESEAKVQAALEKLMRGRTVLTIAHRLSTVKKADLICVLEGGRVVEQGRHDELVAADGLYARMHRTQFGIVADTDDESGPASKPSAKSSRKSGQRSRAVAGE
ncbi:MAG: ABC transporter ATP-binding protein [Hyphomicrobiales bacterium]